MNVTHVGAYVRSPRVARWKKVLAVLAVVYAISPVDLVPDVVPIFGWLDDLGVLAAAFGLVARDMAKHAKLQKEQRDKPAELVVDGQVIR
ncbi:MAG: DUF1232 domain-containing protein [Archangium sp.]|nr:DUF1232 domain-containing protein [Archangium sp.]